MLTATQMLLHVRAACIISLVIVQATGDKSLSDVAWLLRWQTGPSRCPV